MHRAATGSRRPAGNDGRSAAWPEVTVVRSGRQHRDLVGTRDARHELRQLIVGHDAEHRIDAVRHDTHAVQDVKPAQVGEKLTGAGPNPSRSPVAVDPFCQRIGKWHCPAVTPEPGILTLSEAVMQHDEIADPFGLDGQFGIVGIDIPRVEIPIREVLEQVIDTAGNEMDARRFQWLKEARCQAERDAVASPVPASTAGNKAKEAWFGHRRLPDRGKQVCTGVLVAAVRARIDVPVPETMLQRNPPLPPRWSRPRLRIGRACDLGRRGKCDRPVAGQHRTPVEIARAEDLLDEQPAKTTAVEIEFRRNGRLVGELQRTNMAVGQAGRSDHGILDPVDPEVLGIPAQVLGDQGRIEVERIAKSSGGALCGWIRKPEASRVAEGGTQAVVIEVNRLTAGPQSMPGMEERAPVDGCAERSERMPVGMADDLPVDELDAELVRGLRMTDEVGFIDAEKAQHVQDRWNGRLTDADRADIGRLDDADVRSGPGQGPGEHAGGKPARRTAAHDGDRTQPTIGYFAIRIR